MGIKKNFVVKNGLEVADNLIVAEGQKVGIGTSTANYTLDVEGNIALNKGLFVPVTDSGITTATGTVSSANFDIIFGIDPTGIELNDFVSGSFIQVGTAVTGIGTNTINISPNHTNAGAGVSTEFTFTRFNTSGQSGQLLRSRGNDLAPEWVTTDSVLSGTAFTATNVIGGIGSITELSVSGFSTFGDISVENLLVSGIATFLGDFVGDLSGAASTAFNVIGGIGSLTNLSVTGFSTFGDISAQNVYISGITTSIGGFVGDLTGTATTAINVIGGIGSITELSVSGFTTVQNLFASGVTTSIGGFVGDLTGTATTAINVIGGIGSITELSVSGITTIEGSTSTDLLRITQLGTGNAIVVEDDSNPDSSRFFVDSTGRVGVNTNGPLIFDLESRGTTLLGDALYVKGGNLVARTGIASGTDRSIISGIDTTGLNLLDVISDGGTLILDNPPTTITGIGIGTISISQDHGVFFGSQSITLNISREFYAGQDGDLLISRGPGQAPNWLPPIEDVQNISTTTTYFPTFVESTGRSQLSITQNELAFTPDPGNLGIGSTVPTEKLDVDGNIKVSGFLTAPSVSANTVDALTYLGDGAALAGIVTQITPGIGVKLSSTQTSGKGVVTIDSYFPLGRTIFVTQNGSDSNTGLTESDAKRTIKAAAAVAFANDTIKVYPGTYVENNPVILSPRVSIEGTELRNCIVTPKNPNRDLFYVDNSCHVTDLSFTGPTMTEGSAVIAFKPLAGVSTDRYFDAARMIRYNLDFIAAEAVGYLTSTDYKNPAFEVPTSPQDCRDDVKDVLKAVMHDITRGGNSKCVGAGKKYYDSEGGLLHITGFDGSGNWSVQQATIDTLDYAVGIAKSVVNNISWTGNYQNEYTQIRDKSIQADGATGSNEDIGSCANVISAIHTCVGIVTTIVEDIANLGGAGINTSYPANGGIGTTNTVGITSVTYVEATGKTTITAPGFTVKEGQIVEIRDINFECDSGGGISTQAFPSGKFGYEFDVTEVNDDGSFVVFTGISTLSHTYVSGGLVVDRSISVTGADYDNTTGILTVTAPGSYNKVGDYVSLHDIEFTCGSGGITTTFFPDGTQGYEYRVTDVPSDGVFAVNVGTSTIPHTYDTGGIVYPYYSTGVKPITQGPYIRNCTNFIPESIGMKVDGFSAEPADNDDIGVTGSMSVDSYTQFNQGGIGVSITNGAYAQLVSIFTICNDTAIFTASGGQCDLTNSNSSFGTKGLVSDGVGNNITKSIYRYTGEVNSEALLEQDTIVVEGLGQERPYDGQSIYFGELYYEVESITITDGGSGYTSIPQVTIDSPTGPNGIQAEANAIIENGSVTSTAVISVGSQYRLSDLPQVTFAAPGAGTPATGTLNLRPIYYTLETATEPVAGISTVVLNTNLNNTVSAGTTVYFDRLSLQITSSHSFEWVGSGNDIAFAKPSLGGVVIQENEVVKMNGGEIFYTSTDQKGNFRIGDDVSINQQTGTISGRAFNQSLLNTVTPIIIALGN